MNNKWKINCREGKNSSDFLALYLRIKCERSYLESSGQCCILFYVLTIFLDSSGSHTSEGEREGRGEKQKIRERGSDKWRISEKEEVGKRREEWKVINCSHASDRGEGEEKQYNGREKGEKAMHFHFCPFTTIL